MARYTNDSRERVRDAVDFIDLVGARTELRRAGPRRYAGLCPFHEERTPSFGIDPVEKVYHCFGCGEGGDVFKFVMETESLDFAGALEALADRYGVELEREAEDPQAAERRRRRDRLLALLERTAAYYARVLWESPEAQRARDYLAGRGLEEAELRRFRVGYSPSAWDRVLMGSRQAGFSEEELQRAGLVQRGRGEGGGLYDRFRSRLMFPLADARGRVLGFGARALRDNQQPKYLNSSDGEIYRKGRQLFAVDLARAEAARAGAVVLAEGYTDVIALHQAGIRNAVGLMGTALTDEQAAELRRLAPAVLLCLDADAAGQDAMLRAAAAVEAAAGTGPKGELRVVPLPPGSDPADLLQRDGPDAMRALLDRAVGFARFRVERALDSGDLGSPEGRDRVLAEVAPVIRSLREGVQRAELVRLIAGRLALSDRVIDAALTDTPPLAGGNGAGSRAPRPAPSGADARRAVEAAPAMERDYLALCIAVPAEGARRLAAADLEALFASPLTRRAAEHLREHAASPFTGVPTEDTELHALLAELTVRAGGVDAGPPELAAAEMHLELARLDRAIATARAAGEPLTDLATERQRVLGNLRAAQA